MYSRSVIIVRGPSGRKYHISVNAERGSARYNAYRSRFNELTDSALAARADQSIDAGGFTTSEYNADRAARRWKMVNDPADVFGRKKS